jgi:ribose transport system ATP-binding protein
MSEPAPVIEMRGISRSFGATKAVVDVSMSFYGGKVYGLLGQNGAGKSTLINLLTGFLEPDSGSILLEGTQVRLSSPAVAEGLGIATVHQEPQIFRSLTVAENIFVTRKSLAIVSQGRLIERAASHCNKLFGEAGREIDAKSKTGELPVDQQQLIVIARALAAQNTKVLLLDEPTSSLNQVEVKRLFKVIETLKSRGILIIFVSHKLSEVIEVCDSVAVLRNGEKVLFTETHGVTKDDLVFAMTGKQKHLEFQRPREAKSDDSGISRPALLVVDRISGKGFREFSLTVKPGEIIGLYGLLGSGVREIVRTVAGLLPIEEGTISFKGTKLSASVKYAIACGIVYVTSDRIREGVFRSFSIKWNTVASSLPKVTRTGLFQESAAADVTRKFMEQLEVKAESIEQGIEQLSGGNQQKVAMARALATSPKLLLLDEPARGVDIATKYQLYEQIKHLAQSTDLSVVVASSDTEDILNLCETVYILRSGKHVSSLTRGKITEAALLSLSS